jgi:lipid-binding SYLF domain-containing protein
MQTMKPSLAVLIRITLVVLVAGIAGCGVIPERGDTLTDAELAAAKEALGNFASDERLGPFFSQAEIVAVYPTGVRAGFGFGGALGHGVVFQGDQAIGRTSMYQFSVGANVGGQVYRQILFFKTEASFERLMADVMEFAGQANLAVAQAGGSATPSFNTEVAMFTQLRGGLLVEGSVGAHRYTFRRLTPADRRPAPDLHSRDQNAR